MLRCISSSVPKQAGDIRDTLFGSFAGQITSGLDVEAFRIHRCRTCGRCMEEEHEEQGDDVGGNTGGSVLQGVYMFLSRPCYIL